MSHQPMEYWRVLRKASPKAWAQTTLAASIEVIYCLTTVGAAKHSTKPRSRSVLDAENEESCPKKKRGIGKGTNSTQRKSSWTSSGAKIHRGWPKPVYGRCRWRFVSYPMYMSCVALRVGYVLLGDLDNYLGCMRLRIGGQGGKGGATHRPRSPHC
ncbi:hypothetical protein BDV93DRAFT_111093 [Ceratobasidium sp. AG-I]|nr:hypothetical protein BDV93DRAFT_111093 [Ceratobasidium sp. AG-I]